MSNYNRGAKMEYAARRELEARGYNVVRSAGSRGPVDLVAVGKNDILLIQVKSMDGPWWTALDALIAWPCSPNVKRQVWCYQRTSKVVRG